MKIQPYVHKLEGSQSYKQFQGQYKDAFLTAGFFVIDFETGKNVHQIDYFVPSKKKFAAFTLDNKVVMQLFDMMDKRTPEPLDIAVNIDLDALKGILQDELKNRNITSSIKKMIAVIQNIKGKKIWNVNCILSGMEIIKAHIEDDSQTVLRLDKSSLFDYIQRMPGLKPGEAPAAQVTPDAPATTPRTDDISAKLAQLDKLKAALKVEEEQLQKKAQEAQATSKKVEAAIKAPAKSSKKKKK